MRQQRGFTFDKDLQLKDAGAIAASAAAQVGGAAKVLDLGSGRVEGAVVVDVTAIDNTSGDEKYEIELQLSGDNFAAETVVAAVLKVGDSTTTGSSADSVIGRRELWFVNEIAGTRYRYARLFTRVAGTTPSINYTAFVGKLGAP